MKIGQSRVSAREQTLETQLSRLADAGCEMFFEERISGAKGRRPRLEAMLDQLRKDDVVVVTKLDRLARSTAELLRMSEAQIEKGAGIQSLDEPWADTTSPAGKMILTVFGGIAEFKRSLILARTEEGRKAAMAGERRVGAAREASRRPEGGCPRTRQGRPVDLFSRADVRRPSRDDLSVHQGIPVLMTVFRSAQP